MRTQFSILFILYSMSFLNAQVELEPDKIAVNVMNPISTVAVNDVGTAESEMYVKAEANIAGSTAILGRAFDITTSSSFSSGLNGQAIFGGTSNRAVGVAATGRRDMDYNIGRSYGLIANAANSTPGANYGVLSTISGGNSGAAIVGIDFINHGSWSQVMSSTVSYAGYFRGKAYFHDFVGFGEEEPAAKVHVKNGDIYVEGSANGVILDSGGVCYKLQVNGSGVITTSAVACPN